tara:strand:- start:214 stop:444 length:231 start_codon:yes stop_codon:yes gene_type:complete
MTKRKNYPRLREEKSEGTGMPPDFIDEKKKEVVFHIPRGFPVVLAITWMESFLKDYKGISSRCEDTFYRLRAQINN